MIFMVFFLKKSLDKLSWYCRDGVQVNSWAWLSSSRWCTTSYILCRGRAGLVVINSFHFLSFFFYSCKAFVSPSILIDSFDDILLWVNSCGLSRIWTKSLKIFLALKFWLSNQMLLWLASFYKWCDTLSASDSLSLFCFQCFNFNTMWKLFGPIWCFIGFLHLHEHLLAISSIVLFLILLLLLCPRSKIYMFTLYLRAL